MTTEAPIRVLVAGLGNMGRSHALAYHRHPGFEIVGLVNRTPPRLHQELSGYSILPSFTDALKELRPELAAIATYSDTHADYAVMALEQGSHVFIEKPLATTVEDAARIVAAARANGRKLVVGYILRHHPSWQTLVSKARDLGGPFVFRMNLNQQSSGDTWATHKALMDTTPPIVDCGVHYVDVMCQITDAKATEVRGMGLPLSPELKPGMYNYGHFQVLFEDGSIGWYEAGWGPMISEAAFFVKDVMSPRGAVSIMVADGVRSDDVDTHTKTSRIRVHHAETDQDHRFVKEDEWLSMADEPGHQELCEREQAFVYDAIRSNADLTRHNDDAVQSLRICLAADQSVRSGQPVKL